MKRIVALTIVLAGTIGAVYLTILLRPRPTIVVPTLVAADCLFPAVSSSGETVWCFRSAPKPSLVRVNLADNREEEVMTDLVGPNEVLWSPDATQAIFGLTYHAYALERYGSLFAAPGTPDGLNVFYLVNLSDKKITKLAGNIDQVAWVPDGKRIIYTFYQEGKSRRSISIADPDGGNWRELIGGPYSPSAALGFDAARGSLWFAITGNSETDDRWDLFLAAEGSQEALRLAVDIAPGQVKPSFDSRSLAFVGLDGMLGLIDISTKIRQTNIKTDINQVAWASDSSKLYVLEAAESGMIVHIVEAETGQVSQLAIDESGSLEPVALNTPGPAGAIYFTSSANLYSLKLP